jgi:TonB family protein
MAPRYDSQTINALNSVAQVSAVARERGYAMLLKPKITGQAPYGAFDLKINYQYNLLRATLIMVAFVGALVGALFMHSALSETVVIVTIDDPNEGWGVEPTDFGVEDSGPRLPGVRGVRTVRGDVHGIPVPVSIDVNLTTSDGAETSADGNIQVGEIKFGGSGDGAGGAVIGDGGSSARILPGVGEFISHEIAPRALEWALPEYPRLARRAGLEGVVWVNVFVDENGEVQDVRIAKSSETNAGFEEAAEGAAWKCKFSPAIQSGRPIAIWVTFSYEFILSADR